MIGDAIKMYRIMQRYSQKELGERVGLNQTAISKIELHTRKVSSDELVKFAQLFGCKVTDLLINSQIHAVQKERTSVDEESITSTRLDTERKTGI